MNNWNWLEYVGMWLGAIVAAGLFYLLAFLIMSL